MVMLFLPFVPEAKRNKTDEIQILTNPASSYRGDCWRRSEDLGCGRKVSNDTTQQPDPLTDSRGKMRLALHGCDGDCSKCRATANQIEKLVYETIRADRAKRQDYEQGRIDGRREAFREAEEHFHSVLLKKEKTNAT